MTAAIALACGAASCPVVKPYALLRIIITPPTVAAETIVPKNFQASCLAGVVPNQYPIFKSVTKPPAIDNAVQTTPPITRAATIPSGPRRPTATITTEARIRVISVMPDTGFVPTIAIAFAATVVKRNAMIVTSSKATMVKRTLPFITSKKKNSNTNMIVMIEPIATTFIGKSRWVRCDPIVAVAFPPISFTARLTALLIMLHDLRIPMMPAIAIPPIPMLLA